MQHILCVTLGTYCDRKLMDFAIHELAKKYKIVYLTDPSHKLPNDGRYIKVKYTVPEFFLNDPELVIANTRQNLYLWSLSHPAQAQQVYAWARQMRAKLHRLQTKYDFKGIFIFYPAMLMVWMLKHIERVPVYVLYCAPGLVSRNVPWLYDSILRKRDYKLYAKANSKYNQASGLENLKRIGLMNLGITSSHTVLSSVTHVYCWDKAILPSIIPVFKDLDVHTVGSLLRPDISRKDWPASPSIKQFISSKKEIIFVTFGSYGNTSFLKFIMPSLMNVLETYCKKHDAGVIYHNDLGKKIMYDGKQLKSSDTLFVNDGFVQYEYVVPRCKLVIFTGSVCLQNICLYHATPMLIIPILTEQFFWAKNYQHYTKVSYLDYKSPVPPNLDFKAAMNVSPYLKRISKSLHDSHAAKSILDLFERRSLHGVTHG